MIELEVGTLSDETTEGRYQGGHPKPNAGYPYMQDVKPYGWKTKEEDGEVRQVGAANQAPDRERILERFKDIRGR